MSTLRTFHHGDLKAALERGAMALIERSGAEALSLREVAREAGVSTAAPYRHYASKEALLAAVARRGFERMRDELVDAGRAVAPAEAFLTQCVTYVRFAERHPALYRLMFGPFPEKQHYPELAAAGDRLFALLDTPLDGTGKRQPFLAVGCWAFVHGLSMLALDGQLTARLPAAGDEALQKVLQPLLEAISSSSAVA